MARLPSSWWLPPSLPRTAFRWSRPLWRLSLLPLRVRGSSLHLCCQCRHHRLDRPPRDLRPHDSPPPQFLLPPLRPRLSPRPRRRRPDCLQWLLRLPPPAPRRPPRYSRRPPLGCLYYSPRCRQCRDSSSPRLPPPLLLRPSEPHPPSRHFALLRRLSPRLLISCPLSCHLPRPRRLRCLHLAMECLCQRSRPLPD